MLNEERMLSRMSGRGNHARLKVESTLCILLLYFYFLASPIQNVYRGSKSYICLYPTKKVLGKRVEEKGKKTLPITWYAAQHAPRRVSV